MTVKDLAIEYIERFDNLNRDIDKEILIMEIVDDVAIILEIMKFASKGYNT
jgi:hypothetical protein